MQESTLNEPTNQVKLDPMTEWFRRNNMDCQFSLKKFHNGYYFTVGCQAYLFVGSDLDFLEMLHLRLLNTERWVEKFLDTLQLEKAYDLNCGKGTCRESAW